MKTCNTCKYYGVEEDEEAEKNVMGDDANHFKNCSNQKARKSVYILTRVNDMNPVDADVSFDIDVRVRIDGRIYGCMYHEEVE